MRIAIVSELNLTAIYNCEEHEVMRIAIVSELNLTAIYNMT